MAVCTVGPLNSTKIDLGRSTTTISQKLVHPVSDSTGIIRNWVNLKSSSICRSTCEFVLD